MTEEMVALETPTTLKIIPEEVTVAQDPARKKWPRVSFGYRFETGDRGTVGQVGPFLKRITEDLIANGLIPESIQVTNLSRLTSLVFGTTSLTAHWVGWVVVNITPGAQVEEVRQRMARVMPNVHPDAQKGARR